MQSLKDIYFIFNVCYIPFIPLSSKSSAEEMSFPLSSSRPEETQSWIQRTEVWPMMAVYPSMNRDVLRDQLQPFNHLKHM